MQCGDFLNKVEEAQLIGAVKLQTRDPITHKVEEQFEQHNTTSIFIEKLFNTAIRNLARQGNIPSFSNPFNSVYLFNRALTIDPMFGTADLYPLDASGTKFKPVLEHPDIVGYNYQLNTSQEPNVKAGIYDVVMSNQLRFRDTTSRIWIFSRDKAVGNIRSVMLSPGLTYSYNYDYSCVGGCGNRTNTTEVFKKLGLLPNGHYICNRSGTPNVLLEFDPARGIPNSVVYDTKLTNTQSRFFALVPSGTMSSPDGAYFYVSNQNGSNGTISIIKGTLSTCINNNAVEVPIKKVGSTNTWYECYSIFADAEYLYSIHRWDRKMFIAKIDPVKLTVIEYFDYLDNTLNMSTNMSYDENTHTYLFSISTIGGASMFFAAKSLADLYSAKELGQLPTSYYSTEGSNDYGPILMNGLAYSPDFNRITPYNNFGALAVLSTDFEKPPGKELVVQYNHTIVY
jgi:hypothetical protein